MTAMYFLLLPTISSAFAYAPVPSLPPASTAYGSPFNNTLKPLPGATWTQILPPSSFRSAIKVIPPPIDNIRTTVTSQITASPPPPQSFDHFLSNIESLGDDWSIIGPPAFDAPNNTNFNFEPTNENLANALTGGLPPTGDEDIVQKSEEFVERIVELAGNTTTPTTSTTTTTTAATTDEFETLSRTPDIGEE